MVSDYQMLRKGVASLGDFHQLQQEFDMRKKQAALQNDLLAAQAQSERKKLTQVDVDKLGEQAFMKAAMGQPLSAEEQAAAMFIDAKSGGISFNPVTGEMMQKQRLSDRIGLPGMKPTQAAAAPYSGGGSVDFPMVPPIDEADLFGTSPTGGYDAPPPPPKMEDPYEKAYRENLSAARGNPKLEQQITADYMKNRADNQMKLKEDQDKFNRAVEVKQSALIAVNRLLDNKNLKRATGPIQQHLPALSNATLDAREDLNYIKNLMTTENVGLLKGVLSDTDMKILASIGSGELSGSDARVKGALLRMQTALSSEIEQASPYISADPGMTPIVSGLGQRGGLSPDKQRRLQELRAKRDAGTLR